jgi:hypothetical protein
MQAVFLLHVLPWLIRAGHPRKAQMKLLEKIVAGNRKTRFGQEHGFGQIRSHADYMQQVPIQDYETMRHWIASQEEGVAALTRKSPVMYALTSGTSAEPKLLPVTRPAMRCFRLYLAAPYIPGACGIWSCTRYGICSGIR